jgi:hypothetical protein
MRVVKLYRKPNQPEFVKLVRVEGGEMLVNYPINKPDHLRQARWVVPSEVFIDWIKTFEGE